jgi:membrane-associated phospholipid phosphatase
VTAVRSSECVAFAYFLYLAMVCWLRPLPTRRRLFVSALSLLAAGIVFAARSAPPLIRDWIPLPYILAGYYLTGRLFVAPSEALERWLLAWDRRLFGDPTTRFARWPGWLVAYLDIVYVFCFLLPPGGLLALTVAGRLDLADRYWTIVLAANLGAFAPLSVFQTRPPWMLERAPELAARSVHRQASYVVQRATIRANTFPSGHVAMSFAVALAVVGSLPLTGVVLIAVAVSISVACVVGRYHYAVDVVAGALLAGAAWAATEGGWGGWGGWVRL